MNTLTLTLSGMQNNMNGEMNKKLERILRIMEWQMAKIQLLEQEVIALKLASTTELDIDEGDEMELDIDEGDIDEEVKKVKKVKKEIVLVKMEKILMSQIKTLKNSPFIRNLILGLYGF